MWGGEPAQVVPSFGPLRPLMRVGAHGEGARARCPIDAWRTMGCVVLRLQAPQGVTPRESCNGRSVDNSVRTPLGRAHPITSLFEAFGTGRAWPSALEGPK